MKNIDLLSYEIDLLDNKKSLIEYNKEGLNKKVVCALNDIENNRNHTLCVELFNRNKGNLGKRAIRYRGRSITYERMFDNVYNYAKSLKAMGYKEGDTLPICITNTPEFIYLFLSANLIGAKVNIVADWFNPEYLKEIFNSTNSKYIFIDDISYDSLKTPINESNIEKIVCFSLTDSLMCGVNPYQKIDEMFHDFNNNVPYIKEDYKDVYDVNEFLDIGNDYRDSVVSDNGLDDVCSITYTSGTTKPGYPKGVIQSNRSYITLSRFKESDVSGMPTMKDLTVLCHIPTDTHMELSCAISDTLYCSCVLALEPFYDKDLFPYSLLINEPNFVPASAGFWGTLCKKLTYDESFKSVKMPFLMIPTVTGEGLSEGEEKFFNQVSRKHKFGTGKLPFPLSPVTFSIGGGTTESSGIFVTLYKSLQEKKLNHLIKGETLGLTPHKFAHVEVLNKDGDYCKTNEPGLLVANSPCEMIGYTNSEYNKNTHVCDKYGKSWLSLGTYSYKDSTGRIKMKGRMGSYMLLSDNSEYPYYLIEEIVLKDTKNVMSCSVVNDSSNNLIAHIELQPFKQLSDIDVYKSILDRINKYVPDEVKDVLYIRYHDNIKSFPLDPSGKRSISTLKQMGIDDETYSFNKLYNIEENTLKLKK